MEMPLAAKEMKMNIATEAKETGLLDFRVLP